MLDKGWVRSYDIQIRSASNNSTSPGPQVLTVVIAKVEAGKLNMN